MATTSEQGSADRPARIGWHLARARERAGVSLVDAAAAASIPVEELDALESGWRELLDGEAARLALAYGVSLDELIPPRTPVVVDHEARTIGIGRRLAGIGEEPREALAAYLSMIYEARGAARGDRIALRDEDLDVLAGLVGEDAGEVEAQLVELMGCTEEDARRLRVLLFRRRMLAGAAGLLLALGVGAAIAERSAQQAETTGIAVSVPGAAGSDDAAGSGAAAPGRGHASSTALEVGPGGSVGSDADAGNDSDADVDDFSSVLVPPISKERSDDELPRGGGSTPAADGPDDDGTDDALDLGDVGIDRPKTPPVVGGVLDVAVGVVGGPPPGGDDGVDDSGDDDGDDPVVDDGNNGGGNDDGGVDDSNPGQGGGNGGENGNGNGGGNENGGGSGDGDNGGGNDDGGVDDSNPGQGGGNGGENGNGGGSGDGDNGGGNDDGGVDDSNPGNGGGNENGNNGGGNDEAVVNDPDDDPAGGAGDEAGDGPGESSGDQSGNGNAGSDGNNGHGNDVGGVDPSNPGSGGSGKPKKDK